MLFFDVFQGGFQPPDMGMVPEKPEKLGVNPATFLRCGNDDKALDFFWASPTF